VKGLVLATQFLTRLPTPRVAATAQDFAASIRWFPAVGLIVGMAVAGAAWAGAWIDAWCGALAGLAAWVAITGALHLDGLADLADASGAAHQDRARLLAVLADPHLGSFGAVALAVQVLAKLVLLHALVAQGALAGVVLVPLPRASGRWPGRAGSRRSMPGWRALCRGGAQARPGALGRGAGCCRAALSRAAARRGGDRHVGRWIVTRIGGISGDGHGAGIEWNETVLLLGLCVEARLWS
jgi:adenosylcobinamide-GDP ribazoletransferase